MHLSHDPAFKRLFAHPELVRRLLALVPACPADRISGLERVNCSFVSASDRQRYADMVWRVDCSPAPFYVLLEFQAAIDRQMEQRMKVYFGLLSQDLAARKSRELLDLLPVVVYSGHRKWPNASRAKADWLKSFQEGKVFFLIDEEVAGDSIIGDVIRLVRGDSLAEISASVHALLAWDMASDGLKREVSNIAAERAVLLGSNLEVFMKNGVMEKFSSELTPEEKTSVFEMFRTIHMTLKDTPEFKCVIEARAEDRQKGRQEGRQEGRADAMKALLVKACERAGSSKAERTAMIANADVLQLEGWVERLMAGEELKDVLEETGP